MRCALVTGLFLILLVLAQARPAAVQADELLVNGGFEGGLAPWNLVAGGEGCTPRSGSGAVTLLRPAAGAASILSQSIAPLTTGSHTLSGYARLQTGAASLLLRVTWTTGSTELRVDETTITPSSAYTRFTWQLQAPTGAVQANLVLRASSSAAAAVCIDDLSWDGPPLATPSPTSTATATATATPSLTPTSSPTSTYTATLTPAPSPIARPLLFINGGFEEGTEGWQKFGGELTAVAAPRRSGSLAGALNSNSDSTKWAFQTVALQAGLAYEFAGHVRAEGAVAAAYLRLSWYESSDGSGAAFASDDSTTRLAGATEGFLYLTTGPRLPPPGARSLRARVLLTPLGAAPATLIMDDFTLTTSAPTTPTPPARATATVTATATPVIPTATPVRPTPALRASATQTTLPATARLLPTIATSPRGPGSPELSSQRRPLTPAPGLQPLAASEDAENSRPPWFELAAGALWLLAVVAAGYARWRSRRQSGEPEPRTQGEDTAARP